MENMFTIKEASELIRQSTLTTRHLVHRGIIPHVRIGRRILIKECDLTAVIDKHYSPIKEAK